MGGFSEKPPRQTGRIHRASAGRTGADAVSDGERGNAQNIAAQCIASHDANVACKEAIEAALARNDGGAAQRVTEQYGVERTLFVLAETVRSREPDVRISPDNRAWAASQPSPDTRDASLRILGDSALISAFLTQVRQEGALSRERRGNAEKTQSGVSRKRDEKPSIRKWLAEKIPVATKTPAKSPRREAR